VATIPPGGIVGSPVFLVIVDTTTFPGYINLIWELTEQGWPAWKDSAQIPVGVPLVQGIPTVFALEQNYPNPFNPSTRIRYQLPTQSYVSLKVYDVLGREVGTLVDGIERPGYKSVLWDASGVASGVYFYRLQAGQFSAVQKMLLVR